ncbi:MULTISPECIES: TetR/AcrR family transcriptional regulator [unclassified Rhizobacter]|uniref:TetR/AcrR family transcriptional regulator n=1 Tax=unclassified Rhizobacter TaxID=2640088 RepID=UPI0007009595|nr:MULTISPECIES: TetR/AcrR family transcriptional regulator [unclassified Rhizobacter]KQU75950.1 TetR family transcriptional regulator [Rhizobacter sp. Root29]KQW08795.1 TetR family transcriptional regulator [Rhizobacter sp. Root1238]KRB16365.1 TetR family transcriptional regulator [Rhizobacter sp. Root16D2]
MPTPRKNQPALATKKQPAQQRATDTYERILEVTAQTLADVGIERLSTNLVCERAGLTPPALYRYFPNKYALLSELGQRLMQAQNERIGDWISPEVLGGSAEELERALEGLILATHEATAQTEGGVWIMRALRAVPALQEVRLASHAAVTREQAQMLASALPGADAAQLQLVSRIVVELVYATVEMLFDEPLDATAVARTVAGMIASHLGKVRPVVEAPKPGRKKAGRRPS